MGKLESVMAKAKEDVFGSAVLASSLLGMLLSFFYFSFVDGEATCGLYQLLGVNGLAWGLEDMLAGDFGDFIRVAAAMPLYLLAMVLDVFFAVAPFVLLCASLAVSKRAKRDGLIIAALAANVVWYPVSSVLWGSGLPDLTLGSFLFVLLPPAVFLVCLLSLREKPLSAPAACSAFCVVGLLFLATANSPFGYESGYSGYKSFYISKYLLYVATWVASSFAVAVANRPERCLLLQSLGFASREDATVLKRALPLLDSASQLKDLKLLLDEGLLTQEEYDLKKKELMGF